MGYLDHLLATPYAWVTLSGVFVGGALSRMTTPTRADTARARGLKWAAVYVSLSLAVISATLAVFVPDARLIRDVGLAYQFVGSVIVSGLAMRFKLVAGVLVFLLLAGLVVATVLMRQVWAPFTPPQTVATIRVLSRTENATALEFVPGSEHEAAVDDARIVEIPAQGFAISAETIELSTHYFFVGMRYGVRLTAISGGDAGAYRLPTRDGPARTLADAISVRQRSIPGVDISTRTTEPVTAVVLRRYEVRFATPKSIEIIESR